MCSCHLIVLAIVAAMLMVGLDAGRVIREAIITRRLRSKLRSLFVELRAKV